MEKFLMSVSSSHHLKPGTQAFSQLKFTNRSTQWYLAAAKIEVLASSRHTIKDNMRQSLFLEMSDE